ncbi:MAG: bile acid:sodium symporter family protein [Maricaulis sp.]|uniref:bile acid:sodium symporter family protein n=1 Tax=Maricaulis sp. TaxID=1486257 RepID=UPI0025C1F7F8|nr:bile acid:sodium symporter family protein [Maricaulis sp.]MDM7983097.1 bile acid:sodium symporter family protein [Maricaulis sp.]
MIEGTGVDALRVELSPAFQLIMSISLVVMMFTVALGLKLKDFMDLRKEPWAVGGGVLAQVLGLPLLTLGLIFWLQPAPSVALGMIVVASCPGGNVSNALTLFARGDTAYSVSLTSISAVSAAVVTPISILFWANQYGPTSVLVDTLDVDPSIFLVQTAGLLALPLLAGMSLAHWKPEFASVLRRMLIPVAFTMLVGLILVGAFSNRDVLFSTEHSLIPLVMTHNALAFVLGGGAGFAMQLAGAKIRALTFEVGIQNAGLGLLLLLSQFGGVGGAVAVTALWGVWHITAGFILVGLFRGYDHLKNKRSAGT